MLVGKIYAEAYREKRVSNRMVKLSPKAYNVTIQLQYDELTCYMFANIIQAGAISSYVHDFPDTGTMAVRYSLLLSIMNS